MRLLLVSMIWAALLICISTYANQGATSSEKSYQKARNVLDSGIAAIGGLQNLRDIRNVTLVEVGKHRYLHQSPKVDGPFQISSRNETTIADFSHNRLFIDTKIIDPTYYISNSTTVLNRDQGFILDNWAEEAAPLANPSLTNYRNHFFQRMPHFVLMEALDSAHSLRWIGEEHFQGRKQNVIAYVPPDNRQTSLHFDAQTNTLTKIDFIYSDAVMGDGLFEIIFSGYRANDGSKVPTGRVINIAGEWQIQTEYSELRFNSQLSDKIFEPPINFVRVPAVETPSLTVTEISKDVYHVRGVQGSANAFFVAFDTYVLVVDSPRSRLTGGAGERLINKIKESVPNKAIKYLILTNHSYDHSAGARAFIAEGSTIVTTPENKRYIEKLASAPFTIMPDALAQNPKSPVIEIIQDKKRVFEDSNHRVELYDIGPNPISNEIVIVYLPKEKILYQTDLFNPGYAGTNIPAQVGTVQFAEKLKQLGLKVEKIIGGHGSPKTPDDLHSALEKRNLKLQAGQ